MCLDKMPEKAWRSQSDISVETRQVVLPVLLIMILFAKLLWQELSGPQFCYHTAIFPTCFCSQLRCSDAILGLHILFYISKFSLWNTSNTQEIIYIIICNMPKLHHYQRAFYTCKITPLSKSILFLTWNYMVTYIAKKVTWCYITQFLFC